eukprot:TRINITY_DN11424_c2_g1_i1.p1 TRINITY_DN11424_c2_g1~~TRINITY_DN11424_c2_g1_i1.p1  ORF type:complete len:457 (+),score=89.24 TRINITY_DN11424_c2_g1_i1:69-1439(+)
MQSHNRGYPTSTSSEYGVGQSEANVVARQIQSMMHRYRLPADWEAIRHDSGNVYYWNRLADQTTWNHPLTSCTWTIVDAFQDCIDAGRNGFTAEAQSEAIKSQFQQWFRKWLKASSHQTSSPSQESELHARFKIEALASLLSLPTPKVSFDHHSTTSAKSEPSGASSSSSSSWLGRHTRHQKRRAVDGRCFLVEYMPGDNSCGFHGIGISRQKAAHLLHQNRHDDEIQEFVASDLLAAVQTGEKNSFPEEIRDDERLWSALQAYYCAQEVLDGKRREAKDLFAEESDLRLKSFQSDLAMSQALQRYFEELKSQAILQPSGSAKLAALHKLRRCKVQCRELEIAEVANKEALASLRRCCRAQVDSYVAWVGSDATFWLSFLRGCGGADNGGGLLDALAKAAGLTVRVWAEGYKQRNGTSGSTDLELVHEARFGTREVNLWFQGLHFDRLVPCPEDDT